MGEEAPNFTRMPDSSRHEPGFEMTAGPEAVHDLDGFGDETTDAQDRGAKYPAGNSSAAGAVANFVNTIIGAGIIGLPFSIAQVRGLSGWWHMMENRRRNIGTTIKLQYCSTCLSWKASCGAIA